MNFNFNVVKYILFIELLFFNGTYHEMTDKVYVTYERVHEHIAELSGRLAPFQPDVIVAIAGGGLIPARILRTFIRVPIVCVGLQLYNEVTSEAGVSPLKTQWVDQHCPSLENKRIVVLDEVDDTRTTLQFCVEELKKMKPAAVAVAVLQNKRKAKRGSLPEDVLYFCGEETEDVWIVYPWEAKDIRAHNNKK